MTSSRTARASRKANTSPISTASRPAARWSAGKTFWFADYEGSVIRQARTWVRNVPTALQRSSGFTDFSDLISLQSGTVGADLLGRTFPRGTVFDPATTRPVVAGQVDPVTGRVATAQRVRARRVPRQQHSRRA